MSGSTLDADIRKALLDQLYAPVRDQMLQVEQMLARQLSSDDAHVEALVKYAQRLSGKRLRPALVLLSGQAVGRLSRDHIVLATVMEMIHTATLVHDDVLDEADLRRHEETVNARWSNETSVLLGDFLFTHSFYLASTLETTYACRRIGESTNIVCDGELRQIHHRRNFHLTEEEYLRIIDAKTAELTACCCRLGAHYAGGGDQVEKQLTRYGRHLGIAFQIIDDLLDLTGSEEVVGKSLGSDLQKQKMTLPLIRLLELADPGDHRQILSLVQNGQCRALLPWLQRYEAIDYARQKAAAHVRLACENLSGLAESDSLRVLLEMANFVVAREH